MNNAAFPRADLDLAFALRSLIGHLGRLHLGGLLGHALMWLVAQRIGQVCGRMERLVARFRAGKLWTLPGRVVGVKVDEVGPAERVKLERIWPRESAWLVVMGGWKVAAVTGHLEAILTTPEMMELLIAAPAARRMLQPF